MLSKSTNQQRPVSPLPHEDVRALVGLGLVELAKTGRNKVPRVRFEKITLEIAV